MNHTVLVNRLIDETIAVVLPVQRVPLEHWDTTVDTLHAPFGFLPPTLDAVAACPELIVRHVAHLADPEDIACYLMHIGHHICLHITHAANFDDYELERLIDRVMYDNAPRLAAANNQIQMHALEVNLGPHSTNR